MKQLKRETLPGLRTGITVRAKLAGIAQVARKDKDAKFCSLVRVFYSFPIDLFTIVRQTHVRF